MSLNLSKGGSLELKKSVSTYYIGAGWDMGDKAIDVDLSVLVLRGGKLVADAKNVAFYNNKALPSGLVKLGDDNRSGAGDGDDEHAIIDLSKAEADVTDIVVVLNVFGGTHKFGDIKNFFIRLVEGADKNGTQVAGFQLNPSDLVQDGVALEYVRFTKKADGSWSYTAKGDDLGKHTDLGTIFAKYA